MESGVEPVTDFEPLEEDPEKRRWLIEEAVLEHGEDLLVSARIFAASFGLPNPGETLADVAEDIFQASVVRALEIADSFDPAKLPRPWLMAILANVSKEERRRRYRHRKQTTPIRYAAAMADGETATDGLSEDELLDRLRQRMDERDPAAAMHLDELLGLVSKEDREVLRLGIVEDLSRHDLAARFGISEGAAGVRLHRALSRLRASYGGWGQQANREN